MLLFNPPYVPTADHEASDAQLARDISGAWAGGIDGMQVTDYLLPRVKVRHTKKQSHIASLMSLPYYSYSELALEKRDILSRGSKTK